MAQLMAGVPDRLGRGLRPQGPRRFGANLEITPENQHGTRN
jgi:hypothetical protein